MAAPSQLAGSNQSASDAPPDQTRSRADAASDEAAAPRRLMDAHVGGRKVQVLACILDLQPGRYDEIDRTVAKLLNASS